MSKRSAYLIIIIFFLLIIGGLGYFYIAYTHSGSGSVAQTLKNLLPFGQAPNDGVNGSGQTSQAPSTTVLEGSTEIPRLRKISKDPVAGGTSFDRTVSVTVGSTTEKGIETFIRYIDRGTGYIYETSTSTLDSTLISNTTELKNYEAYWGNNGTNVLLRYLLADGTMRNYLATVVPQSDDTQKTPYKLEGTFLESNIDTISISPKKDSFFYLTEGASGATGVIANFATGKRTAMYSSPFRDWIGQWASDATILLTTKASGNVLGYAYTLSTNTGKATKIIGDVAGLTASLNPTGSYLIYSESSNQGFDLSITNTKTGSTQTIPQPTLPEKCVWSKLEPTVAYCAVPTFIPSANYPDSWYQGLTSFDDDIWMLNAETGVMTKIYTIADANQGSIDAMNLFLDPQEKYLFFTNKKDLTLWSLNVSNQ